MAKVIVAWCDPHMANDEHVPGKSFQIAIDGHKPVEVDMCEVHEKEFLTPLLDLLGDVGQPIVDAEPVKKGKPFTCPECQKGSASRDSLGKHLRRMHGIPMSGELDAIAPTVPEAAAPLVHPCPDCDRSFETPQGRGAHRNRVHGYVSAAPSARESREATAARKKDRKAFKVSTVEEIQAEQRARKNGKRQDSGQGQLVDA